MIVVTVMIISLALAIGSICEMQDGWTVVPSPRGVLPAGEQVIKVWSIRKARTIIVINEKMACFVHVQTQY